MAEDKQIDGSQPLKGRQELFVQILAKGDVSATEAYRRAGYSHKSADYNSHRMSVKECVVARIAHIKAEWAKRAEVTREKLAAEYRTAYDVARSQSSATGMVAATTGTARLFGLDKQVVVQEASEEAQALSEAQEADAREFAAWKLRKQLKARSAG